MLPCKPDTSAESKTEPYKTDFPHALPGNRTFLQK